MYLGQKQKIFNARIPSLLNMMSENPYACRLAYALRSIAEAERLGKKNSNHTIYLAIDVDLFKLDERGNYQYLDKTSDHKEFGEYWVDGTGFYDPRTLERISESLPSAEEVVFIWGGDFGDGNHYSVLHNGVK